MKFKTASLLASMLICLVSCHNPVLDYEGDCEVKYGLRFVYDMNLDWADAFPTLVNTVNLYAFDSNGVFVKGYSLTKAEIEVPGYTLTLDLNPGDYTLVAWAGLETGIEMKETFSIPEMKPGVSILNDLSCEIITESNSEYSCYSQKRLPFLYHGMLDVNLPDSQDGASYLYTLSLTKDTNHVRATVQKVDSNITSEEVDLLIEAEDRVMSWDNSLIDPETVTYLPYSIQDDEILLDEEDEVEGDLYTGIVADFMVGRFTTTMKNGASLKITNIETGETIFRVPVIKYALMGKSYFEQAYGKTMTDQEFLDRQSEYFLTFFLDGNLNLLYTEIQILEWRLIIKNYNVDS